MRLLLLALTTLLLISGCKEYKGGAVEIAWVIRGSDQHAYDCDSSALGDNRISKLRLIIRGTEGEYEGQDICLSGLVTDCVFDCKNTFGSGTLRGITSFTIPEGNWYIGLVPLDMSGEVLPSSRVQTPEPIMQSIKTGDLAFMGVWQIVVNLEKK